VRRDRRGLPRVRYSPPPPGRAKGGTSQISVASVCQTKSELATGNRSNLDPLTVGRGDILVERLDRRVSRPNAHGNSTLRKAGTSSGKIRAASGSRHGAAREAMDVDHRVSGGGTERRTCRRPWRCPSSASHCVLRLQRCRRSCRGWRGVQRRPLGGGGELICAPMHPRRSTAFPRWSPRRLWASRRGRKSECMRTCNGACRRQPGSR